MKPKVTEQTKRIRGAITRSGLSLTEFARRLRIGRVTLHRWRAGVQRPHPLWIEQAEKLAEAITDGTHQRRARHKQEAPAIHAANAGP